MPGGGWRDRGSGFPDCRLTPAAAAGLLPNDVVTSFDGKAVTGWDELTEWIRASAGREVSITVERNGAPVTTTVTPVLSARPIVGVDGRQAKDEAGTLLYQDVGFLGIGAQTELVPQPASSVLPMAGENIKQVAGVVFNLPARVVGVAKAAFSEEERDPNGPSAWWAWGAWPVKWRPWRKCRCSPGLGHW
ncbi:putative zinc metalloprotease SCO5695 [Arthrobacter sp. Hiyo4]|nr:putative zinc metalloprotease SCO5695 [Arthrobacter sp. Hiyo4]